MATAFSPEEIKEISTKVAKSFPSFSSGIINETRLPQPDMGTCDPTIFARGMNVNIEQFVRYVLEAAAHYKKGAQEPKKPMLGMDEAIRICLEYAKRGESYGARPIGFKSLVYYWIGSGTDHWELHFVDNEAIPHDDTHYLGEFEVLTNAQLDAEWPKR